MVFKCKMCGGDITPKEGTNIGQCIYCKSVMTLPNLENEKIVNLYNRANDLRIASRFDEAKEIYEKILVLDNNQVEAHWGILLCKFGVEYVTDPKTKKKIPTCNRTINNSIFNEIDFKRIKQEANNAALELYESEAKQIDDIQRGILEISRKEKPYDIFICYKESDDKGNRTLDSVYAQDIYKELVNEGYKVFFSRITLEDKLGNAYEPYIYAALTTSKVMLVVGTKKEYFDAVWVKNEWSRYLNFIKNGEKKTIIPIYKDINPNDLPDELSYLQALNIDKIGFMQDLLHGINKIISKKEIKNNSIDSITTETLNKAYDHLSNKDFDAARKCLDIVQGYDTYNVEALIGRLMIEMQVSKEEDLKKCDDILANNYYYNEILKYADNNTISRLNEYNTNSIYNYAVKISKYQITMNLKKAREYFQKIEPFEDSEERIKAIDKIILKHKKHQRLAIILVVIVIIIVIVVSMNKKYYETIIIPRNNIAELEKLISNNEYVKAKELYDKVETEHLSDTEKKRYEEVRKAIVYFECTELIKTNDESKLNEAIKRLDNILGYKDSKTKQYEAKYLIALKRYEKEHYTEAMNMLFELSQNDYSKATEELEKIQAEIYEKGKKEYDATNWKSAKTWFARIANRKYKDSKELYDKCNNNITAERSKYNGIWMEAQGFWTNLKIDDEGVYSGDEIAVKRNEWSGQDSTYDEDTGEFILNFWDGSKHLIKVNGNRLTLKWLNPRDQYDTSWFDGYNVFYRK